MSERRPSSDSLMSSSTAHVIVSAPVEAFSHPLEASTDSDEQGGLSPPQTPTSPVPSTAPVLTYTSPPPSETPPSSAEPARDAVDGSTVEVLLPGRGSREQDRSEDDTQSIKDAPASAGEGSFVTAVGASALPTVSYPPSTKSVKDLEHSGANSTAGGETLVAALPGEGGLRAWLNVLGGWLLMFASFGYVNAFGVFQSYYKLAVFPEKSEEDISWIGSIQLCLFFLMSLVAGPLFDKGRLRILLVVGSAMWITSIFLIPEATEYWHAVLIQAILGGMGVGLLFLPALSIQSHWFARRRNLAIGIVASASSLGGIAFPIMLNKLMNNPSVGFANGVRASGGVVAGCLALGNLLVSPNPARKDIKKPPHAPLKQLFSLPYSLLALGAMVLNFGIWFPNFYIQVYGQANGVDSELAFYLLAIFNAGSFFGRTIPNVVADHTGPFLVQCTCMLCAGIILFFMKLATSAAGIVIFALLYGFFSGGFISLVSPVIVSLSSDLSEIGLRQGIAFLIVAGAAVGGNPIAGKLLENNDNDFLHPILFAAVMVTAGGAISFLGCLIAMKRKGTWRV
ncbi:hypothetical protein JCM6882_006559 [Rhodosporidiobolus microsporus]